MASTIARSASGRSWMSSTRISMAPRMNRAMQPRAFSHSYRSNPSGSCGAMSRYIPASTSPSYAARVKTRSGITSPATLGTPRLFVR